MIIALKYSFYLPLCLSSKRASSKGREIPTIEQIQTSWQSLDLERQTQVAIRPDGEVVAYAELGQHRPGMFIPHVWV